MRSHQGWLHFRTLFTPLWISHLSLQHQLTLKSLGKFPETCEPGPHILSEGVDITTWKGLPEQMSSFHTKPHLKNVHFEISPWRCHLHMLFRKASLTTPSSSGLLHSCIYSPSLSNAAWAPWNHSHPPLSSPGFYPLWSTKWLIMVHLSSVPGGAVLGVRAHIVLS